MNTTETPKAIPLEVPASSFYAQKDSCYIRIQYVEEVDGFKFEVRNEILQNHPEDVEIPKAAVVISSFVRGMLEVAIASSPEIYDIGKAAQKRDIVSSSFENLGDEYKAILMGEPQGNA